MKRVSSKGDAVIVFSRGADPGRVKTRLLPFLNERQCMALHLAFLKDTLQTVKSLNIPAYLYVAGDSNFPFQSRLPILQQSGNDLGARLKNAFAEQFMKHDRIVVIGTDSPDLPPGRIQEASLVLQNHDAVLGPTQDGGYYLLGLSCMIPEVFENIPWGTDQVFQRTLEQLHLYKLHLLERHYDVDVIEDLIQLEANLRNNKSIAPHTKKWLEQNKNAIMARPDDTLQNGQE